MHYAHTDFLSYEDIDMEVDRIFRAFCDAALVAAAHANPPDSQGYWKQVVEFRRANLSAFDRPDMLGKAKEEAPKLTEDERKAMKREIEEKFRYALTFLYWFDARADYWSRHAADEKLVASMVSPKELNSLFDNARAVQARVHAAEQVSSTVRLGGYWNNGNNGDSAASGETIDSERPPATPSPRGRRSR